MYPPVIKINYFLLARKVATTLNNKTTLLIEKFAKFSSKEKSILFKYQDIDTFLNFEVCCPFGIIQLQSESRDPSSTQRFGVQSEMDICEFDQCCSADNGCPRSTTLRSKYCWPEQCVVSRKQIKKGIEDQYASRTLKTSCKSMLC